MNKNLTIPSDILQLQGVCFTAKCIMAFDRQYPGMKRQEAADMLGIDVREYYRIRNKYLSETWQIQHVKYATVKSDSVKFATVKNDTPIPPTDKNVTDTDVSPSPEEKKRALNYCLRLIDGLGSEEDYNKNKKKILKMFERHDMFTEEEMAMFDEKLSAKVAKFEEI